LVGDRKARQNFAREAQVHHRERRELRRKDGKACRAQTVHIDLEVERAVGCGEHALVPSAARTFHLR
jgi:hypothetical protein